MLTPAEIADEIDRGLDILTTDRRDVPERQRSIRAVFDHSWSLLTEDERDQFQQLCVFRGSFSREAALAVAGTSLFQLRSLLGKSLLEKSPAGRYEIHALLRQYGLEVLNRSPDGGDRARDRHSAYFADRLAGWTAYMKKGQWQEAKDEIEADLDNVRAAWRWATEHGPLTRIEMAMEGLWIYYGYNRLLEEGTAAFQAAEGYCRKTLSPEGLRLSTQTLTYQAAFKSFNGEWGQARALLDQSIAILHSPDLADHDVRIEMARTLHEMGVAADNMREKERLLKRSLLLFRELDDDWSVGRILHNMAWGARISGDYERANNLALDALEIARDLGDAMSIAYALWLLGNITWRQGHYEQSERRLREVISIWDRLGRRGDVASCRALLGRIYASQGRFQQAVPFLSESVSVLSDLGIEGFEQWWRIWLADSIVDQGEYTAARGEAEVSYCYHSEHASIHGMSHSLLIMARADLGIGEHNSARQWLDESVALLRDAKNQETLGLAQIYRAYAALFTGHLTAAEKDLIVGLDLACKIEVLDALVAGVPALALLRARRRRPEQAVELYEVALTHPRVRTSKWFQDLVGSLIADAAAELPPERVAAAQERGRRRDLQSAALEFVAAHRESRPSGDRIPKTTTDNPSSSHQ
jgi:tetratricopeptide (TPR) repeat protein